MNTRRVPMKSSRSSRASVRTRRQSIGVSGIQVEVVRKPIKNLHLSVHPPDGRVRVSAPSHIDDEAVRLAIVSKLPWIRRHQQTFADQPRQSQREMVSGESHYFLGRRYRLNVIERGSPTRRRHWRVELASCAPDVV